MLTLGKLKASLTVANVSVQESILCTADFQEGSHCSPKRTLLLIYSLLKVMGINRKRLACLLDTNSNILASMRRLNLR